MSTLGIGVPVPKMLPVTGTWTVPFAAYLLYLSNRVVYHRLKSEKYIGDTTSADGSVDDPLLLSTRAHTNFLESVPFALLLSGVAELNGANRRTLNYSLATLLVLRVLHGEFGIRGKGGLGLGRPIGYYGTQGFLAGMAVWGGWLVKGYWGY